VSYRLCYVFCFCFDAGGRVRDVWFCEDCFVQPVVLFFLNLVLVNYVAELSTMIPTQKRSNLVLSFVSLVCSSLVLSMSYAVTVSCETSPIWTAYGDTLSPQKSLSGDVNFYDDDFFDEQISFQRYLGC
jgi:hypothetical protein